MDIVPATARVSVIQDFPVPIAMCAPAGLATKRARCSVTGNWIAVHRAGAWAMRPASVTTAIPVHTAIFALKAFSATRVTSAATGTRAQTMADAYQAGAVSVRLDGWAKAAIQSKPATLISLANSAMCNASGIQRVVVLGAVGQMECVSARKALLGPIATCARKACGAHNVTWSVGRTLRAGMEEGVTVSLSFCRCLAVVLSLSLSVCLYLCDFLFVSVRVSMPYVDFDHGLFRCR